MSKTKVCILDYGSGNVRSVFNTVSTLTDDVVISNDPEAVRAATHIILPGVGAFGASMEKIRERLPLDELETEVRSRQKPILGICVGLQVFAEKGLEFGEHSGLGWLPGEVAKLEVTGVRLPHIGWNNIQIQTDSPLIQGLDPQQDFYFVHSFAFRPKAGAEVVAVTDYEVEFPSILQRENILGVQFHPEKSQTAGVRLLRNFLSLS